MKCSQHTICEIIRECLSTLDERKSEKELYFQGEDCFIMENDGGYFILEDGFKLIQEESA